MLKIVRDERSFIVESDDQNAENASLEAAIDVAAPHLAADFASQAMQDDGWLRWRVQREDWPALLEVMETLEDVDPDEVAAISKEIDTALKEPV